MIVPSETTPQQAWKKAVLSHAAAINDYMTIGERDGWEIAGKEPQIPDVTTSLKPLLDALKAVNKPGTSTADRAAFHHDWPPAQEPLIPLLEQNGQSIDTLFVLDDGAILARIGSRYEEDGYVVHIAGETVTRVDGVQYIGRCPARRYFAIAQPDGVHVSDGWQGPIVATCPWPTGREGLPAKTDAMTLPGFTLPAKPTQLIPFPDGQRVLLVSNEGTFVLTPTVATCLLPLQADWEWKLKSENLTPDDVEFTLNMEHGAISPDGQWIAVGSQDNSHEMFNAAIEHVGTIDPASSYAHFALFNGRSDQAIFNACHFHNGNTLGVSVADWPGMKPIPYTEQSDDSDDPRSPTLQDGARVYCGVHRQTENGGEWVVGDAYGYLRAFSETGEVRWQMFIGSTIGAMDISADGKTLVAATCAGFIAVIAMDAGAEPWQIGTGQHRELRRWVFWKDQKQPLLW